MPKPIDRDRHARTLLNLLVELAPDNDKKLWVQREYQKVPAADRYRWALTSLADIELYGNAPWDTTQKSIRLLTGPET